MKRVIYYTLVRRHPNYRVIAVTSEKSRRVFGRFTDECVSTHAVKASCLGKFDTQAEADAKVAEIAEVQMRYKPLHDAVDEESRRLWALELAEIQKATELPRP